MPSTFRGACALSLTLAVASTPSPAQRQVADLDPSTNLASSTPGQFVASGPRLFFSARTGLGLELYTSDGTNGGTSLTVDIWPGANSGWPQEIVDLDGAGRVFFSAQDALAGREPWVSDGTPAGTFRLADVMPGVEGSGPFDPVRVGNRVFFGADDGVHGRELWVTDGTVVGTYRVLDLNPGAANGFTATGAALGTSVVFLGDDGVAGGEPWIADGAPGSATLLADTEPGSGSASISHFGSIGSELLFVSYQSPRGSQIWATGGTPASTRLVFDIGPFDDDNIGWSGTWNGLWFGSTFDDVWVTDGTAANSRRIVPSTALRNAAYFVPTPRGMVFTGLSNVTGRELWISDGTDAGTNLVLDLRPGFQGGVRGAPTPLGAGVLFNGENGVTGREPWFSDGTPGGTFLLRDIVPGSGISDPVELASWPGRGSAVFRIYDPQHGEEPWITDGTAAGTRLLADVRRPTGVGSFVGQMVTFENDVYFFASDPAHGQELRHGREPGGVTLLEDLWPGSQGSEGRMVGAWRDAVYFSARTPGGWRFYRTDGSVGGAQVLASLETAFEGVEVGGRLLFSAAPDGSPTNRELWVSDGTAVGTMLVADLNPSRGSYPQHLHRVGDKLVFVATDGATGLELYESDGTAAGTRQLVDLTPGSNSTTFLDFAPAGDRLFFSVLTTALGRELYATDGTPAGTGLVLDIHPGSASSSPAGMVGWRGELWFAATDAANDRELWRSDGTAAGTVRAVDVRPGSRSANPAYLTPTADGLFFVATDGNGAELWRTDGTPAGTSRVRNIRPGPEGSDINSLTAIGAGTSLLFSADGYDGADEELWTSDGTFAGTRRVADLNPEGDARPRSFRVAGRHVWFLATTEADGEEPWILDAAVIDASLAEPFGVGCPGAVGIPGLEAVGAPRLGEAGFGTTVDRGRPGSFAVLLLGLSEARVAVGGGCELRVGGGVSVVLAPTDGNGRASFPLPIPNLPALRGLELWLQGATADLAGPIPGGTALTAGLRVLIGRD